MDRLRSKCNIRVSNLEGLKRINTALYSGHPESISRLSTLTGSWYVRCLDTAEFVGHLLHPHLFFFLLFLSFLLLSFNWSRGSTVSIEAGRRGFYSQQGKVKVKLSLCFFFNWSQRHEGVLGERMYSSTHSLTSVLDGGEWSASRPGRFTPRERAPGTHWIGFWVGPRAVLDAVVKRKIPSPRRESNLRIPVVQPIAQRYTDWAKDVFFFYLHHRVQTGSGVHPSLLSSGCRGLLPHEWSCMGVKLTAYLHLLPKDCLMLYLNSPIRLHWVVLM
jgi:hypothetical protein